MHPGETTQQKIDDFLTSKHLYQLGMLVTEQGHPLTRDLSSYAAKDLLTGYETLRNVDIQALSAVINASDKIFQMAKKMQQVRQSGGRIFLGGCGATGRLSLILERLQREMFPDDSESVFGFIAGGDVAFVHAIEGFEDFPDYGAKQLMELGFSENDLFLGITEGGETPFVIGASHKATEVSRHPVYFLFCNPESVLVENVARSKAIIEDSKVQTICLASEPMALAGSTRMQASTVLMLAAGLGLFFEWDTVAEVQSYIQKLMDLWQSVDLAPLTAFVEKESDCYRRGDYTIYRADEFSASVFTDTTERAPTFSLASFDNQGQPQDVHSLTYVSIPGTQSAEEAWHRLFLRAPRTLEWSEKFFKAKKEYLTGFDFSENARQYREDLISDHQHFVFTLEKNSNGILISFCNLQYSLALPNDAFLQNLILKMLLNAHSTLVMGRLGRYESHFMTYVRPSNGKLVDRAVRYARSLIEWRGGVVPAYDDVVQTLLTYQAEIPVNESVVLKTVEHYLASSTA